MDRLVERAALGNKSGPPAVLMEFWSVNGTGEWDAGTGSENASRVIERGAGRETGG